MSRDFHMDGNRVVFHAPRDLREGPGMPFRSDDGGRAAAGYRGDAGDCVVRAIAIAEQRPYAEVYAALKQRIATRGDLAARRGRKGSSPRNGTPMVVATAYLRERGWRWVPTMGIGTGCQVHLKDNELPTGRIIVRLSKHVAAIIDGVIHDTYDPSRGGSRCVYGVFGREDQEPFRQWRRHILGAAHEG